MIYRIRMTPEAAEVCTHEQLQRANALVGTEHEIELVRAFDLPEGWLGFKLLYANESGAIWGGISPTGESTT